MLRRFLVNYFKRHRNRANQVFHLVGVPLTFLASAALAVQGKWAPAAICFIGGYLLQFIGHAIEGNDAGETVLVKKWLGMSYVEFGPLSKESRPTDP